jgi:hypothetical protein
MAISAKMSMMSREYIGKIPLIAFVSHQPATFFRDAGPQG